MPNFNRYVPIEDDVSRRFNENMAQIEEQRRARGTMPTTLVAANGASPGKNIYGRTPQIEEQRRARQEGRKPVELPPQVVASDAPGAVDYQAGIQRVGEQMNQARTAELEKRDRRRRKAVGYAISLSALNADPTNADKIALATEMANDYAGEVLASLGEGWRAGLSNKGFERRADSMSGTWEHGIPIVFENKATGEKKTKLFSMSAIRNAYRKDRQFNEMFGNSAAAMFNNIGAQYALTNGFNQAALGKRLADMKSRSAAQNDTANTPAVSDQNEKLRAQLIPALVGNPTFAGADGTPDATKINRFLDATLPRQEMAAQESSVADDPIAAFERDSQPTSERGGDTDVSRPNTERMPPDNNIVNEDTVQRTASDAGSIETPAYSETAKAIRDAIEAASRPRTLEEVQASVPSRGRSYITQSVVDNMNKAKKLGVNNAFSNVENSIRNADPVGDGTFKIPNADNDFEHTVYDLLGLKPGSSTTKENLDNAIGVLDALRNGSNGSSDTLAETVTSDAAPAPTMSAPTAETNADMTASVPTPAPATESVPSTEPAQASASAPALVDVSSRKSATMPSGFENNDTWRIVGRERGLANLVKSIEDGEFYEVQKLKDGRLVGVSRDGKIVRDMTSGAVLSGEEEANKILKRRNEARNTRIAITDKSNVGIANAKSHGQDVYKGDMDSAWRDFSEFKLPDLGDSFDDDPNNEGFNEYKRGVLNKQFSVLFESGLSVDQRKSLVERARMSDGFDAKLGYLMMQSLDNLGLFVREYNSKRQDGYKKYALNMIEQIVADGLQHGTLTREILGKIRGLPDTVYGNFKIDNPTK